MTSEAPDIHPSKLEGFDAVSAIFGDRPLYHFNFVHSFFFTKREDFLGDHWRDVDLILEEADPPRSRIGFRFHRVREIVYSGYSQIMGLYIQRIEERGMEGLRYEVVDKMNCDDA